MENEQSKDVSPIQNGHVPLPCHFFLAPAGASKYQVNALLNETPWESYWLHTTLEFDFVVVDLDWCNKLATGNLGFCSLPTWVGNHDTWQYLIRCGPGGLVLLTLVQPPGRILIRLL